MGIQIRVGGEYRCTKYRHWGTICTCKLQSINHRFLWSSRAFCSIDNNAAVLQAEPFQAGGHQAAAAGESQRHRADGAEAGDLGAARQSAGAAEAAPGSRPETAWADPNHWGTERPLGRAGAQAARGDGEHSREFFGFWLKWTISQETEEGRGFHRLS